MPAEDVDAVYHRQMSFENGEELIFEGEYTKFLIRGANIAELRMSAVYEQPQDHNAYVWRLTGDAASKGLMSKLFGVHFHFFVESLVEPDSFSILHTSKLDDQSGHRLMSESVFDRDAGRVVWTERDMKNPSRTHTIITSSVEGQVQDLISAFYFVRTRQLEPGQSFDIPVYEWGELYRVPVSVVERKVIKTVFGKVSAVRLDAIVFGPGRLLGSKGEMSVWLTDDARHVPVKARISYGGGRIDVTLKKMTVGALAVSG